MVDSNRTESPLHAFAETVSEQSIEGFELLGNETRLAILVSLWEAKDTEPPLGEARQDARSFSELYDRVGMTDSGNFTYHLDKLVGPFVRESDDGYALTTRAEAILRAVFAGTLAESASFEGEPIDADCYRCGSPVVADYDDGIVTRRCTSCEGIWHGPEHSEGTLVWGYRPPAGLENRTPQEFNRQGNVYDRHRRAAIMEGVCPDCCGTVSTTYHVCADHDATDATLCANCHSFWDVQSAFVCDVCKFTWTTPAWGPIFTEVAVTAFFHEHGLDPRELFDVSFYSAANRPIHDAITEMIVTDEEPRELTVTVELDGDRLVVTLDDEARVVDVTEPDA